MKNLIIIPDVHGRTFWKDVVKDLQQDQKVIFLGDYIDPYPHEGITNEQALENFKEIIEFKKTHINQVILLIGNHDHHYFDYHLNGSRKWSSKYQEIHDLYYENLDLFDLTYTLLDGEKYLIFSHAGIHLEWLMNIASALELGIVNIDTPTNQIVSIAQRLNELFKETPHRLIQSLWRISYCRGGYDEIGSCIWADLSEWESYPYYVEGIGTESYKQFTLYDIPGYEYLYQIFGHSQQVENPFITEKFACLDCRKAFKYENGKLTKI